MDNSADHTHTTFEIGIGDGSGESRTAMHEHHHHEERAWNSGWIKVYVMPVGWFTWLIISVAAVAIAYIVSN